MTCAFCGGAAVKEPDPRMPLLRIPSCSRHRNWIARGCGWWCYKRTSLVDGARVRVWMRLGEQTVVAE